MKFCKFTECENFGRKKIVWNIFDKNAKKIFKILAEFWEMWYI